MGDKTTTRIDSILQPIIDYLPRKFCFLRWYTGTGAIWRCCGQAANLPRGLSYEQLLSLNGMAGDAAAEWKHEISSRGIEELGFFYLLHNVVK